MSRKPKPRRRPSLPSGLLPQGPARGRLPYLHGGMPALRRGAAFRGRQLHAPDSQDSDREGPRSPAGSLSRRIDAAGLCRAGGREDTLTKPIPKTLTLTAAGNVADSGTGTEYLRKLHGYDSQDEPTIAEMVRRHNNAGKLAAALRDVLDIITSNHHLTGERIDRTSEVKDARAALAAAQPVALPPVTLDEAIDCPRRPGMEARG